MTSLSLPAHILGNPSPLFDQLILCKTTEDRSDQIKEVESAKLAPLFKECFEQYDHPKSKLIGFMAIALIGNRLFSNTDPIHSDDIIRIRETCFRVYPHLKNHEDKQLLIYINKFLACSVDQHSLTDVMGFGLRNKISEIVKKGLDLLSTITDTHVTCINFEFIIFRIENQCSMDFDIFQRCLQNLSGEIGADRVKINLYSEAFSTAERLREFVARFGLYLQNKTRHKGDVDYKQHKKSESTITETVFGHDGDGNSSPDGASEPFRPFPFPLRQKHQRTWQEQDRQSKKSRAPDGSLKLSDYRRIKYTLRLMWSALGSICYSKPPKNDFIDYVLSIIVKSLEKMSNLLSDIIGKECIENMIDGLSLLNDRNITADILLKRIQDLKPVFLPIRPVGSKGELAFLLIWKNCFIIYNCTRSPFGTPAKTFIFNKDKLDHKHIEELLTLKNKSLFKYQDFFKRWGANSSKSEEFCEDDKVKTSSCFEELEIRSYSASLKVEEAISSFVMKKNDDPLWNNICGTIRAYFVFAMFARSGVRAVQPENFDKFMNVINALFDSWRLFQKVLLVKICVHNELICKELESKIFKPLKNDLPNVLMTFGKILEKELKR